MQLSGAGFDPLMNATQTARVNEQAQQTRMADAQILADAQRITSRAKANGQGATTQITYGRTADGQSYITSITITRGGDASAAMQPLQKAMEDISPLRMPFSPSDMAEGFAAKMREFSQGLSEELATAELRNADANVRNHEGLHFRTAGGLAAGLPNLEYMRGPDGQYYAVAGEVRVQTSATADPEKASRDAATYARAATAPADASAQDMSAARGAFANAADTYGKALAARAMPAPDYNMIA